MQHFKDRSAFETITQAQEIWAKSLLFDDFVKDWVVKSNSDYNHYLTDNQKKLGDKLAAINFLKLQEHSNLKILDIGGGCGHFVKLLNELGHNVTGTEVQSSIAELNALHSHYNTNFFELEIRKQQEFKLPETYDRITALRIVFADNWTALDWKFFKENCFEYLNSGGSIFLKTNIKHKSSFEQEQVETAFGPSLTGWNNLTFNIIKQ